MWLPILNPPGVSRVHKLENGASDIANLDQVFLSRIVYYWKGGCLVNNSGITQCNSPEDCNDDQWDSVIEVNLESLFKLSRAFGKHWIENGQKGKIINAVSLSNYLGGHSPIASPRL